MRHYVIILLIFLGIILSAGCSQVTSPIGINKTVSKTPIPTPTFTPRFQFGDIVKEKPDDIVGKLIMTYTPSSDSYTTRSVIYDEFGRLYYLGGTGQENTKRTNLESTYTIQSAHIDNPSAIPVMKKPYNPKYSSGDILAEFDYAQNGVIITHYDYSNDIYTYRLLRSTGGQWMYTSPESITERRTVIEGKYTKKVTHTDPNSLKSV